MVESIRILIVDDQPRTRQSLKALVGTWLQTLEISEAVNGAEAVRRVAELKPDVVLMDVLMPEMDGLQATRLIKATSPQVKVILLSLYAEYRKDAALVGADAFFAKGEPPQQLLEMLAILARPQRDQSSKNPS